MLPLAAPLLLYLATLPTQGFSQENMHVLEVEEEDAGNFVAPHNLCLFHFSYSLDNELDYMGLSSRTNPAPTHPLTTTLHALHIILHATHTATPLTA